MYAQQPIHKWVVDVWNIKMIGKNTNESLPTCYIAGSNTLRYRYMSTNCALFRTTQISNKTFEEFYTFMSINSIQWGMFALAYYIFDNQFNLNRGSCLAMVFHFNIFESAGVSCKLMISTYVRIASHKRLHQIRKKKKNRSNDITRTTPSGSNLFFVFFIEMQFLQITLNINISWKA